MYINEESLKNELKRAAGGNVTMIDKQKANILKDMESKIVGIDLHNSIFSTLRFPSLPRNWKFLMSPIKWPEKATPNPNGSLFTDPLTIDRDDAMDIGMQCFGGDRFGGKKTGLKMTLNPMAYWHKKPTSEGVDFGVSLFKMLFEDTPSQTGADIETGDVKSTNTNASKASQDVVNAISTYVISSIDAIKPLVEMVAGSSNVSTFSKAVHTANAVSKQNVAEWVAQKNAVFQETGNNYVQKIVANARNERDAIESALKFAMCLSTQELPSDISKDEFMQEVYTRAKGCKSMSSVNNFIRQYTNDYKNFEEFDDDYKTYEESGKHFQIKLNGKKFKKTNESMAFSAGMTLNERDYEDGEPLTDPSAPIDYDRLYIDLFNQLSTAMNELIGPRDQWNCFKKIEDEMKFLKDSADKEINAKIELVCKTGANSRSMLKYPFKAEGLKGMWARYSSELQQRINNRIAQLKGSHGGPTTGSANMVEDFLRVTYPQIIAMMLTYRCIFEQLKELYKGGEETVACTLEDGKDLAKMTVAGTKSKIEADVLSFDTQIHL